ncbi:hypothetical protein [Microbispora sp. NBRC 16548]|uniref:hypothetical protein n=1 Tax=Microbispora sp. NBRC 16548 TaxID=3030994 RepID=UPI0024A5B672|nr:hypothetical protein [Microbispora sp. NBRC 16548]GLX06086.1 hypothetical protein Misp03_30130 [Microbispora sp. NBRC 16548]
MRLGRLLGDGQPGGSTAGVAIALGGGVIATTFAATTTHLDDLRIGPWEGLGVTAAWAAAALLGAWLLVGTRDVGV